MCTPCFVRCHTFLATSTFVQPFHQQNVCSSVVIFKPIANATTANSRVQPIASLSSSLTARQQRNAISAFQPSSKLLAYVRYDDSIPVLNVRGYSHRHIPGWFILAFMVGALYFIRRIVVIRHLRKIYKRNDLPADIAAFYNLRSAAWESVWGEHMHHGLYDIVDGHMLRGSAAQVRTMAELLRLARTCGASILPGIEQAGNSIGPKILDVGCGIGGASRFLARTFGHDARVHGITLSPVQAARGTALNEETKLSKIVSLGVQNAHATNFETNSFDLVWSLESAEHMDDKRQFVSECTRVLRPGAPFVMLAWCCRESITPYSVEEQFALRKIMEQYCLPRLAPPSEYQTEMLRAGLIDTHVEDWTDRAAPFWNEVIRSAIFNPKGIAALCQYGWPLLRSAIAARHVVSAIKLGVFRLVAFTGRKPTESEARELSKVVRKC